MVRELQNGYLLSGRPKSFLRSNDLFRAVGTKIATHLGSTGVYHDDAGSWTRPWWIKGP